jgi:hypothetical protein
MEKPLLRLMRLPHLATETRVYIFIANLKRPDVVVQTVVVLLNWANFYVVALKRAMSCAHFGSVYGDPLLL